VKDIAGMNIAQKLVAHYEFTPLSEQFKDKQLYSKSVQNRTVKLLFVEEEIVNTQFIPDFFSPQLIVFVSKHRSISGIPTLSVHAPGNLGAAELGGLSRRVSISPASSMKDTLLEMTRLAEEGGLNYQISYECTHHGPSLEVPSMFAELGSSLKQWKDNRAAEVVAHAIMIALSKKSSYPTSMGIGGPHYNKKFTRIALSTPKAFGHIISKHSLPHINIDMIKHCIEKTVEKVESVILDWKGIKGADKKRLIPALNEVGLPLERV
jgi:D-aminoacyl-tRNA deacylase